MKNKEIIENIKVAVKKLNKEFQLHNGEIIFIDFKNGVLYLELSGSCMSCYSSACGVISNFKHSLKVHVIEVEKVVFI